MAETTSASVSSPAGDSNWRENKLWKGTFAVAGIMLTLVTYGVLQVYKPKLFVSFVFLRSPGSPFLASN